MGGEAFIWDATNGMLNLETFLVSQTGLNLTGWTLVDATGISDDGLTIVGYGINPGGLIEGFVAVIPGPGALALLAVASLCGGPQRRRLSC